MKSGKHIRLNASPLHVFHLYLHTWARLVAALCALLVLTQAQAKEFNSTHEQVTRQVIEAQLAAFQKDDAKGAFELAAPVIQRMFGNPDRFLGMVKRQYRMVYRPNAVQFISFSGTEQNVEHLVQMIDEQNNLWTVRYSLEKITGGQWRISACEAFAAAGELI